MANPEQSDETFAADTSNASYLEGEMADVLTKIYWERRVNYQLEYYQDRAREYEQNVDVAFRLGAILMTISSLLASLGVVLSGNELVAPLISLLTAIIPAVVSYIAAFRQLYQWDRQVTLYRDTQINLETAKLAMPDLDSLTLEDASANFPILVSKVEDVLMQEISQWGQIARGEVDDDDGDDSQEDFNSLLLTSLTDSEGNINQAQLDQLQEIFRSSQGAPKAGQYRQAPEQLETNSALLNDSFYEQSAQRAEESRIRRERAAEIARSASQAARQVTPTSQAADTVTPPVLPSATAQATGIGLSTDVEETALDEPDPVAIVEAESVAVDPEPEPEPIVEAPIIEVSQAVTPLATPDDIAPIVNDPEPIPLPSSVTMDSQTVNVADNVVIGESAIDEIVDEAPIEVEDDSEPLAPDVDTLAVLNSIIDDTPEAVAPAAPLLPQEDLVNNQFPEETQSTDDVDLNVEDPLATTKFDSYAVDDVVTSDDYTDTYDDDSDDYDVEEIDNY